MSPSGAEKRKEILLTIHRHWIWAARIQEEYFGRLKAKPPDDADLVRFFLTGDGMYVCLWFGLEYAVFEALQQREFIIPKAQKEIKAIVQPNYLSSKTFNLLNDPTHQTRILRARKEIGQWLSDEIGIKM